MILYTIIPMEYVLEDREGRQVQRPIEVKGNGYSLLVEATGAGTGRIVRLVSTDPAHFLDPELQPGKEVPLGRS